MMVVVQTGQLIFYNTLVQDPGGGFYTISEMKFIQFQNFLQVLLVPTKHAFNCNGCTNSRAGTHTFLTGTNYF